MIRLRRKHKLPVEPADAARREVTAAENLGEAREAHAQQQRARQDETHLVRTLSQALENNSIAAILRDSIMHARGHDD